jgi:hypothetical protein
MTRENATIMTVIRLVIAAKLTGDGIKWPDGVNECDRASAGRRDRSPLRASGGDRRRRGVPHSRRGAGGGAG